jgi:hypothetical protein
VHLDPGVHTLRLDYFQGPMQELALQLFVSPPGGTERPFVMRVAAGESS